MSTQSLEDLKRENAELEVEQEDVLENEEAEKIEKPNEETEAVTDTEEEDSEGSSEEALEPWMQSDEQTSHDNGVPVSKHVAVKHKLKGQLGQKDSEIEQLKKEIEQLKQGYSVAPNNGKPVKPTLENFDFDNEKYAQALADYADKLVDYKLSDSQQKVQADQSQAAFNQSVDEHYQRAANLVAQTGISENEYQLADTKVRQAIELVMPQRGDSVTDYLLANLGEGSEKVAYNLGINNANMLSLQSALKEDPTGMQAMLFLGQLKERLNSSTVVKKISKAPRPGTPVNGDASSSSGEKAMRKKYDAMHKAGDAGAAFKIKREAKKAGYDTNIW